MRLAQQESYSTQPPIVGDLFAFASTARGRNEAAPESRDFVNVGITRSFTRRASVGRSPRHSARIINMNGHANGTPGRLPCRRINVNR
jgi:hypothetical protein